MHTDDIDWCDNCKILYWIIVGHNCNKSKTDLIDKIIQRIDKIEYKLGGFKK